jgi:hypothetical protein
MLAALASVVHDRQNTADYEGSCDEDHQYCGLGCEPQSR